MGKRKIQNIKNLKFLEFHDRNTAKYKNINSQKLTPKRKSSFNWSFLGFIATIVLMFVLLNERAWSGVASMEVKHLLDQVSKATYENQLIFEELSHSYKKENFEISRFDNSSREYIISPSVTKK